MERLDKIIANYTKYSRSEIKTLIKQKRIKINNELVLKPELKINIENNKIYIDDKEISLVKNIYLVLNKPKGYITSTEDRNQLTILNLISEEYKVRNIFPVGRLDKDTTGLIILTNDGNFAHSITSPKKDKLKIYHVEIDKPISEQMQLEFEKGVNLKDFKCKPAKLEKIEEYTAVVAITEGKYHQIKRMFGCFGAKVVNLKRIQIGKLKLPKDLKEGEYRELSSNELKSILE